MHFYLNYDSLLKQDIIAFLQNIKWCIWNKFWLIESWSSSSFDMPAICHQRSWCTNRYSLVEPKIYSSLYWIPNQRTLPTFCTFNAVSLHGHLALTRFHTKVILHISLNVPLFVILTTAQTHKYCAVCIESKYPYIDPQSRNIMWWAQKVYLMRECKQL